MKLIISSVVTIICLSLLAGCAVTTKPMLQEDVKKRVSLDRDAMYKDQEPLNSSITVEDAMARAIKYNLDHRLKIMESALALRQTDLMTFDMLPKLVAAAGYTERNSYNASSSMNVETGVESLAPSTSQEMGHFNTDLMLTWNILDFGVSYFQAKQQADRTHILNERRRKVVHSIMQQVRQAYWLALGAQELQGRFDPLLKDVLKALEDSRRIEQEKLRPQLETLTYRKTLLEIMKQLEAFRDELAQAKPRLASLMNLPLGQSFSLTPSKLEMLDLTAKIDEMENKALLQRPELMESDYTERISVSETRKAILRMLPGIEMSIGNHTDNNSFLVNQQWVEGGARLTWNLMNLLSGPSQYKIASSQVGIAQTQRLVLSIAILTQVHAAYSEFYSRKRQYELSEQLQEIDAGIHRLTKNQTNSGAQNQLSEIRSSTASLMAEYRSYQNYAALQNSCGQILATLGEDPLPRTVTSHEIKALSTEIGNWLHGSAAICTPVSMTAPVLSNKSEAVSVDSVPETVADIKSEVKPVVAVKQIPGEPLLISETSTAPSTASVAVEARGELTAPSKSKVPAPMVLHLQFDTAQSEIKPEHHAELKKVSDYFVECPDVTAQIYGHTDDVRFSSNQMGNLQLSERRAQVIRKYLIKKYGIDPKRIIAKGFGAQKPIGDNRTEEGRQKNRRIEVIFKCDEK